MKLRWKGDQPFSALRNIYLLDKKLVWMEATFLKDTYKTVKYLRTLVTYYKQKFFFFSAYAWNTHHKTLKFIILFSRGFWWCNINRIIEWFGLEGTFEDGSCSLTTLPRAEASFARSCCLMEPDLEDCQWWGIQKFSGQPVPVSHHLHSKKFLPYVQSKSTLFQIKIW